VRKYERLWIAAVVGGALLAGLPIILAERVVNTYIDQHARSKLETLARGSLALTETRLEQAMNALVDLAATGMDSCATSSLEAMRRAVFASVALKEIAILDPEGRVLCTHIGTAGETRIASRDQALPGGRLSLAQVRFRDHSERALRLSLALTHGGAISALVSAESLLPEIDDGGRRFRLMLEGGEVVAARPLGEDSASRDDRSLSVRWRSDRFPLTVIAERSRGSIAEEYDDLLLIARLTPTIVSFFVIAFSWLSVRRSRTDPTAMLARALDAGEIIPYYQPIVDITTGRLRGAEVLARWRRSDGTVMSPAAFLPYAERSELIYQLTLVLMRRAREEMGEAYKVRPNLKLAFNLHAGHFLDTHIVEEVREIYGGSPIPFKQIVLEVTEREPVADLSEARQVISELQKLGCKVAIDDVGTGHGGLSYLLKLGVNFIKIDKMFIDGIGNERYSKTIIETLTKLAHNMGMEVIAEGVESFEQVEYLRAKGIKIAQGYVFAPPLPASSYLALVEAMEKPEVGVVVPLLTELSRAS
jgi:sensor c-di-GMP phosphodiesterase-like protein